MEMSQQAPTTHPDALVLQLRFTVDSSQLSLDGPTAGEGLEVADLVGTLDDASWLLGLAFVLASGESATSISEDPIADAADQVALRRLSYASPVQAAFELSPAIAVCIPALAALTYGVRRMFSLDLVILTDREEQRERLAIAKRHSFVAEQQYKHAQRQAEVVDDLWLGYGEGGRHPTRMHNQDSYDGFQERVDRSQLSLFVSQAIDARGALDVRRALVGDFAALTEPAYELPESRDPGTLAADDPPAPA